MSDTTKLRPTVTDQMAEIDAWLDGAAAETYWNQPLAQDWARVSKVIEELGEAVAALISYTGQNPRKPQRPEARAEMIGELADVAATALLAIQHFEKDADETVRVLLGRLGRIHERIPQEWRSQSKGTSDKCVR